MNAWDRQRRSIAGRFQFAPLAIGAAMVVLATACTTTTTTTRKPSGGTGTPPATTTTAAPNYDIFSTEINHHAKLDVARALTPSDPLTDEERDLLASQLVTAREVAMRYPTAADGLAAGLTQAGGFYPMQAAHFANLGGSASDLAGSFVGGGDTFDPTTPLMWLYDGIDADSEVVGLMYYAVSETEPEGFAGSNDRWHTHTGVCFAMGEKIEVYFKFPVEDTTAEECAKHEGAQFMDLTGWMLHVWVAPGWENPIGVFNDFHINLRCPDGTVDNIDEFGLCADS